MADSPVTDGSGASAAESAADSARAPGYWAFVPDAFAALRFRNYRLYFAGQLISLVGTWMQRTAQGWLVTDLVLELVGSGAAPSVTNLWVGIVSAAGTLPVLFLAPFTGIIADYNDKRRVLLITQSLAVAQAVALTILTYTGLINLPLLISLALFLGFVFSMEVPARQGLAIELVGREVLPNAIALNSSTFNIARLVGPGLTGVILALNFKVADAFLFNAVSFLAVIVALILMRGNFKAQARGTEERESHFRRVTAGVRFLFGQPGLRRIVAMVGITAMLTMPVVSLLPAIARYQLKATAPQFGFMAMCIGIGALAGALALAYVSARGLQLAILRVGYIVLLTSVALFTQVHSMPLAYALLIMAGFGFPWVFANSNTIVQLKVPDSLRGRAMGTYSMVFMGSFPIGTLTMGALASRFGAAPTLLTGVIITALMYVFFFVLQRQPDTTDGASGAA